LGPKLQLDGRTLSRFAYYILIPAYTFDVLSKAEVNAGLAGQMAAYATVVHVACAGLAYVIARLLKRPPKMVAAYMLVAVFGNVGNFGLPIVQFRYPGDDNARVIATVYFLAIFTIAFIVGVAVASWHRGGRLHALIAVFKTPALIVVPPALLLNALDWSVPPLLARPLELLGSGMIPTMLVALGIQLAQARIPRPNVDMVMSNVARLIGGPLLAFWLVVPFGLVGLERSIGILQSSMPAAVLASIIAVEHDLLPEFVITSVFFSTIMSLFSLAVVLTLV
jgi:predicted permease